MLKGTATIELTDVKTGKKEVVKHDNLVTNAIQAALSTPFAFANQYIVNTQYGYLYQIVPICPNLVGGVLLYEDALEEDPSKFYAPQDNKLIGYSGNDVNETEDIMRGSMNQTESGPLEDGSGYRFVFDFTTSQANGTISSVGLTSKWGGAVGFGTKHYENAQSPSIKQLDYAWSKTNANAISFDDALALENCLAYDENTETAYFAYVFGQNSISAGKVHIPTKRWKLAETMRFLDSKIVIEPEFIETKIFAGTTLSSGQRYVGFCDGRDGYLWGFEHSGNAKGNSSGKATVNWIKISTEDFSFEEGTWEIDAQLHWFGWRPREYDYYHINSSGNTRTNYDNHVVITGGKMYCYNYSMTGVYCINLANITDIIFYEHPSKIIPEPYVGNSNPRYATRTSISLIGNNVCFLSGYLNKDEIIPYVYTNSEQVDDYTAGSGVRDGYVQGDAGEAYPKGFKSGLAGLQTGVFRFFINASGAGSSGYVSIYMYLMPPYLATINNLATPVQKTADKTMKITYILREETA